MLEILGLPFDRGIVEQRARGAAAAPHAIQKIVGRNWKFIDVKGDFELVQNKISEYAAKQLENGLLIAVGGDHSVSYGLMRAFAKKFKSRALIYFDAHLDCEDGFLPPSHEDVIRAAIKKNFFEPNQILIVGARKFYPEELQFIRDCGVKIGRLDDIWRFVQDKEHLYISVDIDVIDPKYAPGTGWPEPGGLTPKQLEYALATLSQTGKVRAFDLVEICPKRDNGRTVQLGAKILIDFLEKTAKNL